MYMICDNRPQPAFPSAASMPDSFRVVNASTRGTIGLVVPFPGATTPDTWRRTVNLMHAAADLRQALGDMMEAYAAELGVPSEACDKGVFKQAWAAIYKAEGAA